MVVRNRVTSTVLNVVTGGVTNQTGFDQLENTFPHSPESKKKEEFEIKSKQEWEEGLGSVHCTK